MANSYSDYTVIRVTPTLTADSAYSDGDVLFDPTEIPNAVMGKGGCSKLLRFYLLDKSKQTFDAQFYFCEANTSFATSNMHNTANITDANLSVAKICAVVTKDHDQGEVADLDNAHFHQLKGLDGGDAVAFPTLLQAAAGSTSVFVTAILSSDTPTFGETDDLELILHIQRR